MSLTQLTADGYHTCGLGDDGHAYCWGYNDFGQVGDGTGGNSRLSPVAVAMLPQPPTSPRATAADRQIDVVWDPPTDLGSGTLTGYTATAAPGGATCTTTGAQSRNDRRSNQRHRVHGHGDRDHHGRHVGAQCGGGSDLGGGTLTGYTATATPTPRTTTPCIDTP